MKIIRVEDHDGNGPYSGRIYMSTKRPLWHSNAYNHDPVPPADGIPAIVSDNQDYLYGFKDVFQFLDWFGHEESFETMKSLSFRVVQLFVYKRAVIFGGHQLVFNPDECYGNKSVMDWSALEILRSAYEKQQLVIPTETES